MGWLHWKAKASHQDSLGQHWAATHSSLEGVGIQWGRVGQQWMEAGLGVLPKLTSFFMGIMEGTTHV